MKQIWVSGAFAKYKKKISEIQSDFDDFDYGLKFVIIN